MIDFQNIKKIRDYVGFFSRLFVLFTAILLTAAAGGLIFLVPVISILITVGGALSAISLLAAGLMHAFINRHSLEKSFHACSKSALKRFHEGTGQQAQQARESIYAALYHMQIHESNEAGPNYAHLNEKEKTATRQKLRGKAEKIIISEAKKQLQNHKCLPYAQGTILCLLGGLSAFSIAYAWTGTALLAFLPTPLMVPIIMLTMGITVGVESYYFGEKSIMVSIGRVIKSFFTLTLCLSPVGLLTYAAYAGMIAGSHAWGIAIFLLTIACLLLTFFFQTDDLTMTPDVEDTAVQPSESALVNAPNHTQLQQDLSSTFQEEAVGLEYENAH